VAITVLKLPSSSTIMEKDLGDLPTQSLQMGNAQEDTALAVAMRIMTRMTRMEMDAGKDPK
jgi:hypothetical protein